MATKPHSLIGYSILVRNLLRGGGPSVDDDRYSLRLIGEQVLTQAAAVRQAELFDLERLGHTPNTGQMITTQVSLTDYTGPQIQNQSVVLRQAQMPDTLMWRGDPAVFGLMMRPEDPAAPIRPSSTSAIMMAKGKVRVASRPAGWFEGNRLVVALPVDWAAVRNLYVRYVPAAVNLRLDGSRMDDEADELTINAFQWSKIQPLVIQALNPMVQTTPNRDTKNNGKEDAVQ